MSNTPANTRTFRPRQALLVVASAVILGVLTGAAISVASGWVGWNEPALIRSAVAVAGIWVLATLLGVQILVVGTGLAADRLGFGVLASSMSRMLFALLVGVVVYFLIGFEGRSFWVCFLGAGLAALVAEAVWAIGAINAATKASATAVKHGAV